MKIKYLFALPIVAISVFLGISLAHAQVFTDNLYYGLQNNSQVTQLQEFLTSQNLYSGPITGNFYFLTLDAVKAFQTQQGISPAAGYFGPITMAAANKIADAEVGASNSEAISETGTSTPPTVSSSSTPQLELEALLQEVALLEQQLQTQQSSTQAVQNLQTQVQSQTPILQQIASNTQPTATVTQPNQSSQAPTANFTVNGYTNSVTIPYNASATISWSSTNANSCNISPLGSSGLSGNQSTGDLIASQTYTLSCLGAGGSTSASVTVNVSGAPSPSTVSISSDSTQPLAGLIAMGSMGNVLAVFRFTNTTNVENVEVTQLTVHDTLSAGLPQLSNLTLWNGSILLGSVGAAATSTTNYTFQIQGNPIIIPQGKGFSITLKGDVSPYLSGATDAQGNTFSIQSGSVTASGENSNVPATVTLISPTSNTQTIQRSYLTVTTAANNGQNHNKSSSDVLGTITFSANNSGSVAMKTLTLTFSGSALEYGSSTFFGGTATNMATVLTPSSSIQLIDQNGANVLSAGEAMGTFTASQSYATATATWTFTNSSAIGSGLQIQGGNSYTFTLKVNDAAIPGVNGISQSLSANIQNPGDVTYWDALDTVASAINSIPTSTVPLGINSVSYGQGQ